MFETIESGGRPRWRIAFYTACILIAAFVIPPFISLDLMHLDRFRGRLIASIGRSLGRRVVIGTISLRLLPRPGFDLSNFVVDDDPLYGPEPVLRAAQVRARLRLASLWRGRLEIASLGLENASLNLVRGRDGSWNLEQLLLQAAQTPSAPTARTQTERRPRFPYIEVTSGRINFKSGDEKKVFALNDAEFALWLASENRWNLRLKAHPMRTDENLADTGTISVSGSFDRARSIDQIPFHLKIAIENAQLGQLTRLIYGNDRGWHAGVRLLTELLGTPGEFSSNTEATFSSFRRYDIATASNLDLRVRCAGKHQRGDGPSGFFQQTEMDCILPVGDGRIHGHGTMRNAGKDSALDLNFTADRVPVSGIAFILLHAKSTLPPDFSGSGVLNGDIGYTQDLQQPPQGSWKGILSFEHAVLRSRYLDPELALGNFNVTFGQGAAEAEHAPVVQRPQEKPPAMQSGEPPIASIVPFEIALGPKSNCKVSGEFSGQGYRLQLEGPAEIKRLLELARTVGVNAPGTEATGEANLSVQMFGRWQNFSPAQLAGAAELNHAVLPLRGISEPLSVTSALVGFDPIRVEVEELVASFPRAKLNFSGRLQAQRLCPDRLLCNFSFTLQTPDLESAAIQRLLPRQNSGFPFFSSTQSRADWLLTAGGTGTISAARLRINALEASNASATLVLKPGQLVLKNAQGDLLGGRHAGDWTIDLNSEKPSYAGSGTLQHVNMQALSTAMKESWGSGDLNLQYRLTMYGSGSAELLDSATGSAQFDWRNGKLFGKSSVLSAIAFSDWSGKVALSARTIHLEENQVSSNSGIQRVSGTVALDKNSELEFKKPKGPGFLWHGPLDAPQISELPNKMSLLEAHQ